MQHSIPTETARQSRERRLKAKGTHSAGRTLGSTGRKGLHFTLMCSREVRSLGVGKAAGQSLSVK